MNTDILIIGGGLAGLYLASRLQAVGQDFQLYEARDRFGGRIKTETSGAAAFDMGPAWFWPGQPRLAALITQLGLTYFDQYATGALSFEDDKGHVVRGRGISSMEGSFRLTGGFTALAHALADQIPTARKHLNEAITGLEHHAHGVVAKCANGQIIHANRVVLAAPPRVMTAQISFVPALPDAVTRAMNAIPTWMAGQAKAVAVYDTAFWRDDGLSGDASSRHGPMVEIHDASPADGGPYALFGFIGVPPQGRIDTVSLKQHVTAQLVRLFGPQAASPRQLWIKDWATDPNTATQADQAPLYAHPQYGLPLAMQDIWDGQLLFGGTEVAPTFGGYLEGALEAGDTVFAQLGERQTTEPDQDR